MDANGAVKKNAEETRVTRSRQCRFERPVTSNSGEQRRILKLDMQMLSFSEMLRPPKTTPRPENRIEAREPY